MNGEMRYVGEELLKVFYFISEVLPDYSLCGQMPFASTENNQRQEPHTSLPRGPGWVLGVSSLRVEKTVFNTFFKLGVNNGKP